MSCGNTPNGLSGEISDRAAQTLDNVLKRRKNLVLKALTAQLSPDLLDGVHLGGIRRDMEQGDVGGNLKRFGVVPGGSVTAERNMVFRKSA